MADVKAAMLGAGLLMLLAIAGALWAGYGLGRRSGGRAVREQLQSTRTLNAIMTATAIRHDPQETLGLILELACRGLAAMSGSLHLAKRSGEPLRLLHAVNIEDLAALSSVPAGDPLVNALAASESGLVVTGVPGDSQWSGLASDGEERALAAIRVGRLSGWHGLLILIWPGRPQADVAATLLGVGQYTRNVLAEFEAIEQRGHDFELLNRQLQQMEKQSQLAAVAAHDMGAHLTTLTVLLDLRQADLPDGDGAIAERREVEEMLGHLAVMDALRKELLAPEPVIQPEPVPISALLELLPSMMARRVKGARITFEMEVPGDLPPVWGERVALMRVLDNLLNNAVKYNRPEGWIRLQIRRAATEMEFAVANTGPALPPESLPHLFEFGYRAPGAGKVAGFGIGLYSCQRIVAAHGGRIWAEAMPDGNRFIFTVPVAAQKEPAR
jgi:signal transduction histidine kinase